MIFQPCYIPVCRLRDPLVAERALVWNVTKCNHDVRLQTLCLDRVVVGIQGAKANCGADGDCLVCVRGGFWGRNGGDTSCAQNEQTVLRRGDEPPQGGTAISRVEVI